jgi:hypothetical protein
MVMSRRVRSGEGPLDRLLAQLVSRARTLTTAPAISELAVDVIELAVGVTLRKKIQTLGIGIKRD